MALTSDHIFLNLPVKDVQKSTDFFKALGFAMNPQFSDENTSCIIIGDNIFALIMSEDRFKDFTDKEIVDTSTSAEVILALSAKNRDQVDEIINKALAAGGKKYNDPQDYGFMYQWSFQDLDGHLWEIVYMDESALQQEGGEE